MCLFILLAFCGKGYALRVYEDTNESERQSKKDKGD